MKGTVITNKGMILITKLLAADASMKLTRAAVGTGSVPSGYDSHSMTDLAAYKMDGEISAFGVDPANKDVAFVSMQISSVGIETGFTITEAGVYAEDPDEGEILYAYLDLTEDPQYIYAEGAAISKFAEITFEILIGEIQNVTAIISPNSLVTREEFERLSSNRINIIVTEENPPAEQREANTWYYLVTDRQTVSGGGGDLKVSPNMGLRILS